MSRLQKVAIDVHKNAWEVTTVTQATIGKLMPSPYRHKIYIYNGKIMKIKSCLSKTMLIQYQHLWFIAMENHNRLLMQME